MTLMMIYCEKEGCERHANILFHEGTTMRKCPTCGVTHDEKDYHELCYEHAYEYFLEKHYLIIKDGGYFDDGFKTVIVGSKQS